jgi:hypothetical protein
MAAAIIAITPSALDKKLSPSPISQFDPLGSGQCIIVWVLHLQLALDQPPQHHPFSRAFCSFYVVNSIQPPPQNNHDGRPKRRRRLNSSSPTNTPAIDRFIPSCNRSSIAASIPHQSAENRPSSQPSCYDDSFTDRPLTQDQSLLPSPPFGSKCFVTNA